MKKFLVILLACLALSGCATMPTREEIAKIDYGAPISIDYEQAIIDAVKTDETGIGYVGIGYVKTDDGMPRTDIKVLGLTTGTVTVSPLDAEAVAAGRYPLTRPLYQYFTGTLKRDSLLARFLQFEMSAAGQQTIEDAGFLKNTESYQTQNQALFDSAQ